MKAYEQLGADIGRLVESKQKSYGDSFGKSGQVLRLLYPTGITLEQLDDALTIVRIVDKLFRIATDRDALGESPYRDICGYGLSGAARVEKLKALSGAAADYCRECGELRQLNDSRLCLDCFSVPSGGVQSS